MKACIEIKSEEERRIYEALGEAFEQERARMAKMLASKPTNKIFGEGEFELRDHIHRIGARALEVAAEERQKKG